jgi:hypothetical protein
MKKIVALLPRERVLGHNEEFIRTIFPSWEQLDLFSPLSSAEEQTQANTILTRLLSSANPAITASDFEGNKSILEKEIKTLLGTIAYTRHLGKIQNLEATNTKVIQTLARMIGNFNFNLQRIRERCVSNRQELTGLFGVNMDLIRTIKIQDSDPHNKGQRVAIIEFQDGTHIVYKPRDIRIDAHVVGARQSISELVNQGMQTSRHQELVKSFIDSCSSTVDRDKHTELVKAWETRAAAVGPKLSTYKFLACEDEIGPYGFVEYLAYSAEDSTFDTAQEARTYYRQMGRLAGIARIFGITDLHQENILVHRKLPHLIDLEFTYDYQTLIGTKATYFTLISSACLYGHSAQNVVYFGNIDRKDLHKKYAGDIMLGYIDAIVALRLIDIESFLEQRPEITRVRCALEHTMTFKGWPARIITGENKVSGFVDQLLKSLPPPYTANSSERDAFVRGLEADLANGDIPIFYQDIENHCIIYHDRVIFRCEQERSTTQQVLANLEKASSSFLVFSQQEIKLLAHVEEATSSGCSCM